VNDLSKSLDNRPTRRAFTLGLAAVAGLAPARSFGEATYPNHPVRIIVPFPPGGGADLIARLLSLRLQQLLGQPFVVENRVGAAGRIGTGVVAKSDPDGHTLLMTTESSLVIAPHAGVALGYDPRKDFAPISLLTRNAVILVVHPSVPASTLQEYIALARARPGELFYASSGVGGPNHLAGETFNRMAGLEITHVPFPGTGGAIQAVIGNQVGAMWGFIAGLVPHVRAGALACPACRAYGRRGRRARLRRNLVDRAPRPRRDAVCDRRQAVAGRKRRDARQRGPRSPAARRLRHRGEQPRRLPTDDRRRLRQVRQARGPAQGREVRLQHQVLAR
jgi:tripartite-type tricarboxylate transporter receptor subunit TctC